ncbi:MAG: 4Fe-4S binding protein, partial [Firmicutes bacterium]|nr:4Fe-4S binding protein [Bacillota bacterium]
VACTVKCKKKIIVDTLHDLTALKSTVAFVKCSGDGRTNYQLQQMGITSCDEAAKLDLKALNLCHTGCFGCGKCTEVCRYDAIHVENGIAKVDPDKCVGCKDCTFACPQHLITIVPYKGQKLVACSSEDDCETKAKVCGTGCLFCEDCKANCPNLAIYADGTHTVIDPEICEDCHVCQYVCPRNVIKETVVPEYIFAQREALGIREGE